MAEDKEKRSQIMRAVKSRNTKPELFVRHLIHTSGYRYRLHRKDLPGKPDLVFISRRKVIFVHGCFWHGHGCRRGSRVPKTNQNYWVDKINRNIKRDKEIKKRLNEMGWSVLVIWECQLKNLEELIETINNFLGPCKKNNFQPPNQKGCL
ncbi:very short patch repair endonuclease [Desulfosarcina ovata]|uniref:very short patch repair endonuclease n=1 Tax=Desulfosarcina ovata TaxID=83564 RepID=UPI0012D3367C|nr:very short patch repair endonuclease [Desulfosarcina ovata]